VPGLDFLPVVRQHRYENDFDGDEGDIIDEVTGFVINPQGEMHFVAYSFSDFGNYRKLVIGNGIELKTIEKD
jgi:hypothetical protein